MSLATSKRNVLCSSILFLPFNKAEVDRLSVDAFVAATFEKGRPQSRPCWHQKLLLVRLDIDDTVLIFHQVFEARSGIENGGIETGELMNPKKDISISEDL